MSVLNQSGEEQVECPLCMEPLEVDDLNFFPCTCGYQICRFCWHRIRLDENGGLCPACRKAYSENPADFIPLSQEQVAKLKAEKRQRDQQRKAKLTESRKHLASVRVVQRNLVFVVGLPPRLADAEVLKRHEYFGKFGKIHKVVINQSTSYAGSQGPSASAYVTYIKSEDALRAIQAVNNVTIDNRVIKSSLGTTKYCSHFMKNQSCPKPDCMYLHEYGDPEASFTKEQMHVGKHQEYEKRLHDDLIARAKVQSQNGPSNGLEAGTLIKPEGKNGVQNGSGGSGKGVKDTASCTHHSKESGGTNNRETWPQLDKEKKDTKDKSRKGKTKNNNVTSSDTQARPKEKKDFCSSNNAKNTADSKSHTHQESNTRSNSHSQQINSKIEARHPEQISSPALSSSSAEPTPSPSPPHRNDSPPLSTTTAGTTTAPISVTSKLPTGLVSTSAQDDNTSFFSMGNPFGKLSTSVEKTSITSGVTNGAAQLLLNGIEAAGDREHSLLDDLQHRIIEEEELRNEEEHTLGHQQVFTDSLPTINTSEDWVAAFVGLAEHNNSREHDLLQQKIQQQQREQQMSKLSNYGGFGPLPGQDSAFGSKGLDNYNGFYEMSKMQENLMDALASKTNGLTHRHHDQTQPPPQQPQAPPQTQQPAHINGLDQNMSKFFSDFNKFNSKEPPSLAPFQNGFNGLNSYHHNLLLQQKHIEEQLMNLGLKQSYGGTQNTVYQNGLGPQAPPTFGSNGDSALLNGGINGLHSLYSKQQQPLLSPLQQTQQHNVSAEAELDFDPFQETQKALAELIEREQGHKPHNNTERNNSSSHINGLVLNNNHIGGHIPPPPPGFLRQQQQQQPQASTHMNSFGSKILPYLNMSNSQQQINGSTNNWPSSFHTSQIPQQPTQKNITNTCNDWKVLDPAILSTSSRNYQLPQQMPPLRDHFASNMLAQSPQIQPPQQNGSQPRLFDYPNANGFSNFTSEVMTSVNFSQLQQPPSYNNAFATHLNTQPNLTWYNNDLNSQISSPPGFRQSQATKQQEC